MTIRGIRNSVYDHPAFTAYIEDAWYVIGMWKEEDTTYSFAPNLMPKGWLSLRIGLDANID